MIFRSAALAAFAVVPFLSAQQPLLVDATPTQAALAWEQVQRADDAAIVQTRFVTVNESALLGLVRQPRQTTAFSIELFGQTVVAEFTGYERSLQFLMFSGRLRGLEGTVELALAPDGATAGAIEFDGHRLSLVYTGVGRIHALHELGLQLQSQLYKPCGNGPGEVVTTPVDATPATPRQRSEGPTTIDVAVFYTPRARANQGGTSSIEGQIALHIRTATTASSVTGVPHVYRLVYVAETNYSETGTSTDLSRFRAKNDGYMDEVHGLRSTYGADLMALIINNSSQFCGVGYLMSTRSSSFRSSAFCVVVRTCLSNHSLVHEMGHNMGCNHDRANAGGGGAYSYSYGARTSNNQYRSIMAYSPGTRVNKWSGTNVTQGGLSLGNANNDNVRSLINVTGIVAAYWATRTYEWTSLAGGIAGQNGMPTLTGQGTFNQVVPIELTIGAMRAGAPGALAIGGTAVNTPLFGGTLVPTPQLTLPITGTSATQQIPLPELRSLATGVPVYFQALFLDAAASQGVSASDGLMTTGL